MLITSRIQAIVIKPAQKLTRVETHEKDHGNKRTTTFGTNEYIESTDKTNPSKLAWRLNSGYFFKSAITQRIHGEYIMGINNQHPITISTCIVICSFRPREVHTFKSQGKPQHGAAPFSLVIKTCDATQSPGSLTMKPNTLFYFQTTAGLAEIRFVNGRYDVYFEDEGLGSYHSPQHAAEDISRGSTFSHSSGVDLSGLNIPADPLDWHRRTR